MNAEIEQYINSGLLEAYVIGAATPDEELELIRLRNQYPEVKYALQQLENDFEHMAKSMAISPPTGTWNKIEDEINGLITRAKTIPEIHDIPEPNYARVNNGQQYLEVEAESSHMRIHKNWKWVFAAIFVLGKIFLACAIYFYLENRQAQQQILELKQEMRELKR